MRDVARFALILLTAAIPSAGIGTLTLLGDNLISRSDALRTAINWWASDAIAIITFGPFLLLYVAPRVNSWMAAEAIRSAFDGRGFTVLARLRPFERHWS